MTQGQKDDTRLFPDLREQAYNELRKKYPEIADFKLRSQIDEMEDLSKASIEELPRLIHEVQVYQIELELQNEELRRAQEQLSATKDKYHRLYDSAPVGYVSLNSKGQITEANAVAAEMLGTSVAELRGQRLSRYVTHEDAKAFHHLWKSVSELGRRASATLGVESPDGSRFIAQFETTGDKNDISGEPMVQVVMSDVTELEETKQALEETNASLEQRVRERTAELEEANTKLKSEVEERRAAQTALQHSEEQLRAVFEGANDLIFIKDEDRRIVHVNTAVQKSFGMRAEEILGRREDVLEPESADLIEDMDKRVLRGEVIEFSHGRAVDGDNKTFLDNRLPLRDDKKKVTGICVISRDITERSRALGKEKPTKTEYRSPAMHNVLDQAAKIAGTDGIVLLLGESGSGKDYLARWIHDRSLRKKNPYFALNCAALTPELAESELFGHEPGAFTGARGRKRGLLELAEGGTILLNEIGELPLPMQSKLLTFLDTRTFLRVGGEKAVSVNARLMAATHRDLSNELENGSFLEPLYHRLNVFCIEVPPLRERKEDMPVLVEQLVEQLVKRMNMSEMPVIDRSIIAGLAAYNWPGNVRELKNTLERALMLWNGERFEPKLPQPKNEEAWADDLPFPSYWTLREVTDEITKNMCMEALRRTGGNKKETAKVLGISRDALYRYIRRFGIEPDVLT